jgi:hypothetical protein
MRRRTSHVHISRDGPVSAIIHEMQSLIRRRLREMTPEQRGTLWRSASVQETHFYSFLRGGNSLSAANLDALCRIGRICFSIHEVSA